MVKKISYDRLMELYKMFQKNNRIKSYGRVFLYRHELEFLNTQFHTHPLMLSYQKYHKKNGYLTKLQFAYLYIEMLQRPELINVPV